MPSLRPRGEEQGGETLESGRVEECTDALRMMNTGNMIQIITHYIPEPATVLTVVYQINGLTRRGETLITIYLLQKLN